MTTIRRGAHQSARTRPRRGDGNVDIVIPDHFLGGKGHMWIFFSDRKAKRV
ncbi:hypothetical protein [Sphingobacterium phlebotomi]|uniref:hypothetical protein n=1 Tax=Sphingobacterium phlebotomi TaxID=2605433 RepID=UPI0016534BF7|nr:hypothetical protein [Sphingobacterium phlebotomi]